MNTLLLVANYDSGAGYAWWLMESFWAKLAEHYHCIYQVMLAYPHIGKLSPVILDAQIRTVEQAFSGTSLRQVIDQCRFLRRHQVRVIYFSDHATCHWRYGLYRCCGVQLIIVHDHTPGLRASSSRLLAWLKRLAHRLPCLSVDGAIGATDFVRQRLIGVNGVLPEHTYAVPNGLPLLDPPPNAVDLHTLFQIPTERKILVMAARATPYKGVLFVLKCINHLSPQIRGKLHFLFIGDGPGLKGFITAANDMGIADNCTFAGHRSNVPSLLEGADIAIHPSKGEVGYSLSILEYMQAGLPVIVPDNPSVCGATVHGVTGLVYPEGNIRAASVMIEWLSNDGFMCARLGREARMAAKRYSLKATHSKLLDAFEKIDRRKILIRSR